ncbi:MAG: type II toxin-antitoxin system Phd/YefM family antitoxin [Solirubrobacterales bacterium]|nr:type II toxin-antitoxin system Phd/YefM family antitoxin [Solirubrobacterales bacterium]
MQVNVHDAKTRLSELLAAAEAGDEVVIARNGAPVVRLVPITGATELRQPGFARGELWMSEDFDELPAEVADALEREL